MNIHELCCVGHITKDKIVTPKKTVFMPGGTSFYFSHAIKNFDDIDYALVTALAETEMAAVDALREDNVKVEVMPSAHTVYFENISMARTRITGRNGSWRKPILSRSIISRESRPRSTTSAACLRTISHWKWFVTWPTRVWYRSTHKAICVRFGARMSSPSIGPRKENS